MKSVLIVDNQISSCSVLSKFLKKNNYKVETTTRGKRALEMAKKNKFDLILADYQLPDITGNRFFDEIKKLNPDTQMILMGREVLLKNAVEMIRRGATNFISKPLNPDELIDVFKEAEKSQPVRTGSTDFQDPHGDRPLHSKSKIVAGKSAEGRALIEQVKRVAPTNFSVIIQGETGTGKESIAKLIHSNSTCKDGPFIAVDCGCLSREIGKSELFGHEKGAYTGAFRQKLGLFEQANDGTLFLDEIANLPLDVQIGLLRVLQEKVIRRVGGTKEIPINIRIIVATNENLMVRTETSNFREDLYFRLCEYILDIPPLRNRMDDFPLFLNFFLEQTSIELDKPKPTLCRETKECLQQYNWPGNIRELRNIIRRACLFVDCENIIRKDSLPAYIQNYQNNFTANAPSDKVEIKNIVAKKYDLKSTALRAEYHRIVEVLEKVRFNKTKAAEILNIHRKTLYVKLKSLNIPY